MILLTPRELVKEILNHTNVLQQDYHVRAYVLEKKIKKLFPSPKYEIVYDDMPKEFKI